MLNNYYAKGLTCDEYGSRFVLCYNRDRLCCIETSLIGVHNVLNILLSIAMARLLGVSFKDIVFGVLKLKSINARLEKFVLPSGAIVINNGYNSNIDSVNFSLSVLKLFQKNKKVVVTPGLVETENDFVYNEKFGEIIAKYATDVFVVKDKNKEAILSGLKKSSFCMDRVVYFKSFDEVKCLMEKLDSDYVFLIENDLPDNYK